MSSKKKEDNKVVDEEAISYVIYVRDQHKSKADAAYKLANQEPKTYNGLMNMTKGHTNRSIELVYHVLEYTLKAVDALDKKVDELSKKQKSKSVSKQIKIGVAEQKEKVTTLKEMIEQGYLEEEEGLHE